MGLTGKYKFEGIQKVGTTSINAAFAGSPLLKVPFVNTLIELLINLLANKGLVVANLAVYKFGGANEADSLERALGAGIAESESGKVLTPEEIKRIDDEVIKAARKALPYGKSPSP